MTMADDAGTLVAVLPARPLASLTELVATAAGAGATAVMVALAGQAARAARLPFELADFAAGALSRMFFGRNRSEPVITTSSGRFFPW